LFAFVAFKIRRLFFVCFVCRLLIVKLCVGWQSFKMFGMVSALAFLERIIIFLKGYNATCFVQVSLPWSRPFLLAGASACQSLPACPGKLQSLVVASCLESVARPPASNRTPLGYRTNRSA